jgi:ribosomal protein L14
MVEIKYKLGRLDLPRLLTLSVIVAINRGQKKKKKKKSHVYDVLVRIIHQAWCSAEQENLRFEDNPVSVLA